MLPRLARGDDVEALAGRREEAGRWREKSTGRTLVHVAAEAGAGRVVRWLVEVAGVGVDEADAKSRTALYEACNAGREECAGVLMGLGASVHAAKHNDWNPLHAAASGGSLSLVRAIVGKGADVSATNREKNTPLHLAARGGHSQVVAFLVREAHADVHARNHNDRTPLLAAVQSGDVATVEILLQAHASACVKDKSGGTVWHEAATVEDVSASLLDVLERATAAGGNPGTVTVTVTTPDVNRRTPLHVAAAENNASFVRWVGENLSPSQLEAALDAREAGGTTALQTAAVKGHLRTVNYLLDYGADVSARDAHGRDALALALAWNRADVALALRLRLPTSYVAVSEAKEPRNMPLLSLGTYKLFAASESATYDALEMGYRGLDCAAFYANETDVGRAISRSGVRRSALFITSKVWNADIARGTAKEATHAIVQRLGVAYVDLLLVHWPVRVGAGFVRAYQDLCALRGTIVKHVGVSNFTPSDLEELRANVSPSEWPPAVNQIEMNPVLFRPSTLEYCRTHGIALQAYRTLAMHRDLKGLENPVVARIVDETKRTPAQVMNRWCIQHGVAALPKSVSKARIAENADVFGFTLSPEQMHALDNVVPEGPDRTNAEEKWMASVYAGSVVNLKE